MAADKGCGGVLGGLGCSCRPRRLLGVVLLAMIFAACHVASSATEDVREYCEDSTFEGRCAEDEVIVMKVARYGRMRGGTCVSAEFGHLDCARDVLQLFDRWCSGRPSCDVKVSDLLGKVTQLCSKDLRNYLEASYECVKVVWPTVERCVAANPVISLESGYLSNYVTEQTSCGNIDSPWVIKVPQGQQINLTLYDFAHHPPVSEHPNICQVLAVIKDRGFGSKAATKTICNGAMRKEHIMRTQTNEVEIRFVQKNKPATTTEESDDGRHHIVKFEAVGCPDLDQANMWFHRTLSTARVGCEGGDESWQLLCEGTEWQGNIPDCGNGAKQMDVIMNNGEGVPYGVSVAIILAIALMIGAVILAVGLVVIRRRRSRNSGGVIQREHSKISNKDDCYVERIPYTDHHHTSSHAPHHGQVPHHGYQPTEPHSPGGPYNGENTYYRTWQLQRHSPHGPHHNSMAHHACGAASIPPLPASGGYQAARPDDSPPQYVEHIYESPTAVRKDIEALAANSESLKYYELDPSVSADGGNRSARVAAHASSSDIAS